MVMMAPAIASAVVVFWRGGAAVLVGTAGGGFCGKGGKQAFQFTAAVRAGRGGLVHPPMEVLVRLPALRATIFIDGHGFAFSYFDNIVQRVHSYKKIRFLG